MYNYKIRRSQVSFGQSADQRVVSQAFPENISTLGLHDNLRYTRRFQKQTFAARQNERLVGLWLRKRFLNVREAVKFLDNISLVRVRHS